MRDYDEVTQTVLRRRDEAIAKDRRRAVIMRRSAAAALSVCAAAFVGFGVFRMNSKDIELPDDGGIITAETTVPPASHSVSTSAVTTDGTASAITTFTSVKDTAVTTAVSAAAITTAPKNAYTAAQTSGLSTAPAAAAATSFIPRTTAAVPAAATTVTTTRYKDDYLERSVEMKKFTPFAASLIMMANAAAPLNTAASPGTAAASSYDEFSILAGMDNGDTDIDINMDGQFDVKDCFYLMAYDYRKELEPAIENNILSIADFDMSGSVDHADSDILLKYLVTRKKAKGEYLSKDYYADFDIVTYTQGEPIYGPAYPEIVEICNSPDFDKEAYTQEELDDMFEKELAQTIVGYEQIPHSFADTFIDYLRSFVKDTLGGGVFSNSLEMGDIVLDIDGDGQETFDDACIYMLFNEQRGQMNRVKRNHEWIESLLPIDQDPEGLLAWKLPDLETSVTDEQWAICEADYRFFANELKLYDFEKYATEYLLEKNGRPDDIYFDNDHYTSIHPDAQSIYFGDYVRRNYDRMYPVDEKMVYDEQYMRVYSNDYYESVASGEVTPMDATGDGVLDYKDILIADMYLYDYKNSVPREQSIIPDDVWSFFTDSLDINGNGLYGDLTDVSIYQFSIYVYRCTKLGEQELPYDNRGEYLSYMADYRAELTAAKFGERAGVQPAPVMIESRLEKTLQDPSIVRNGDANCDGDTDLADAIFIMQSMANPDKYNLSNMGRFNGDVCETGGGITANDALSIQSGLLNGAY